MACRRCCDDVSLILAIVVHRGKTADDGSSPLLEEGGRFGWGWSTLLPLSPPPLPVVYSTFLRIMRRISGKSTGFPIWPRREHVNKYKCCKKESSFFPLRTSATWWRDTWGVGCFVVTVCNKRNVLFPAAAAGAFVALMRRRT